VVQEREHHVEPAGHPESASTRRPDDRLARDRGGLFETTDDGDSWTNIGPAAQAINVVDIAPDGTLYAGTIGNGIWRFGK
jgi:hypothetical protein